MRSDDGIKRTLIRAPLIVVRMEGRRVDPCIRMWLDAPGFRDVPGEFNLFRTNGVPPQSGKRASYDFRKLYAEDPITSGGMPKIGA